MDSRLPQVIGQKQQEGLLTGFRVKGLGFRA